MYLSEQAISELGLKSYGINLQISDKVSFYNPSQISIGSNTRIDDFTVLSAGTGGIEIGEYVHIGPNCSIVGAGRIFIGSLTSISHGVKIFSSNDDYSGEFLVGNAPRENRKIFSFLVYIGHHCIIGANSVLVPMAYVGDNSSVGALSFVKGYVEQGMVYAGVPAKKIGVKKESNQLIK